jgi:fermentation-respiration switch protein FrsA (DUF1100 family)
MTANLKTEEIPAGGIADFVMTDEQIEQLETEELQEQFGTNGIAQFSDVGKKMANFGRYGDDTVAHVETGELIVPRALIEKNPELKESIFNHLRELGVEDPERYVVGEVKNSLNPTTGLPEFFFKKIFKSISKVAKGVGKALKKAAPIIIPMALNYFAPGLGTVMSGALGAGITTLVQGGSVKDAFKSALVGGATGAVVAGVGGKGNFMENIQADVSMGTTNIGEAFSQGSFEPLRSADQFSIRDLDADVSNDTSIGKDTIRSDTLASNEGFGVNKTRGTFDGAGARPVGSNIPTVKGDPYLQRGTTALGGDIYPDLAASQKATEAGFMQGYGFPDAQGNFTGQNMNLRVGQDSPSFMQQFRADPPKFGFDAGTSTGSGSTSMFDNVKNFMMPSDASQADLLAEAGRIQQEAAAEGLKLSGKAALEQAKTNLNPNFLQKYGPSIALATAAGAAGGMFDVPEEEEQEAARTGLDVYNENPDLYRIRDIAVRRPEGPVISPSSYKFKEEYTPYTLPRAPFQRAAEGGEIFPRRAGGIMPNEGIPNKDSVRAMLMPGEFVMTTDAVKGLGGGDMNKGISNMYGVMRNLEQRGKAMA